MIGPNFTAMLRERKSQKLQKNLEKVFTLTEIRRVEERNMQAHQAINREKLLRLKINSQILLPEFLLISISQIWEKDFSVWTWCKLCACDS